MPMGGGGTAIPASNPTVAAIGSHVLHSGLIWVVISSPSVDMQLGNWSAAVQPLLDCCGATVWLLSFFLIYSFMIPLLICSTFYI